MYPAGVSHDLLVVLNEDPDRWWDRSIGVALLKLD